MDVLSGRDWPAVSQAHEAAVDDRLAEHLARRQRGEKHPVEDFLFTYYRLRPAALRRWHPGLGTALAPTTRVAGANGPGGAGMPCGTVWSPSTATDSSPTVPALCGSCTTS